MSSAPCPFCQSEIDEDLIIYGGTCPKCFGEIPGEEVATDPGAEVRAKQEQADNRRARRRAMVPVALATLLVFGLGGFAVMRALTPERAEPLLFDEEEIVMLEGDPDAEQTPEEQAKNTAGSSGKQGSGSKGVTGTSGAQKLAESSKNQAGSGGKGFDLNKLDNNGGTGGAVATGGAKRGVDGAADIEDIGGLKGGGVAGGIDDIGMLNIGRETFNCLANPDMVKRNIALIHKREGRDLLRCYEDVLKTNEGLAGRYRSKYEINKEGRVTRVQVVAVNGTANNPTLQSCMERKIQKWKFSCLKKVQPVEKTWSFRPS